MATVRYTITHRGVPIGSADVELGPELVTAPVQLMPAYEGVRSIIRAATDALRELGFPGPPGASDISQSRGAALGRAATLGRHLELRDDQGVVVAADFVELMDGVATDAEVTVWVRARLAPSVMPARKPPAPGTVRGSSRHDP
jgi:hypothetical protein